MAAGTDSAYHTNLPLGGKTGLGIYGKLGANWSRGGIRTHRKQLGRNEFLSPLLQIHEFSSPSSHAQLRLSDFTTTVTILNILNRQEARLASEEKGVSSKIIQRKILTNRLSLAKAAERKG